MNRLELDSDGWAQLTHAYGSAAGLPALLRRLPDAPPMQPTDEDAWYYAWSALCHQYSVSTASYAAVPHLVEMAGRVFGARRLDFLSLVASIEAFRQLPGAPEFPRGLEAPYREALPAAKQLAIGLLEQSWGEAQFREVAGTLAVLCGHARLGAGIFLGSSEFTCMACGETELLPGYAEFPE